MGVVCMYNTYIHNLFIHKVPFLASTGVWAAVDGCVWYRRKWGKCACLSKPTRNGTYNTNKSNPRGNHTVISIPTLVNLLE